MNDGLCHHCVAAARLADHHRLLFFFLCIIEFDIDSEILKERELIFEKKIDIREAVFVTPSNVREGERYLALVVRWWR